MFEISVNRKKKRKGIAGIVENLPQAAKDGIWKALEDTRRLAVSFAPGPVKGAIRVEWMDTDTKEVIAGRVFNDTAQVPWSSYAEFGTGLYVDNQGNEEAIRLKKAKKIPWYIHISMVPESFARYGYPVVIGANGQKYYEVDGMKPHPYMHPAAFQNRDKNTAFILEAIRDMIRKEAK